MIVLKVAPLSWLRSPLTFSRTNNLGCLACNILAISKNIVPLVSSKPPRFPAMLKDWQGNPPTSNSWSGISSVETSTIDLPSSSLVKFFSYIVLQYLSHSFAYTHSWPNLVSAKSKPPTPANKLINFISPSVRLSC